MLFCVWDEEIWVTHPPDTTPGGQLTREPDGGLLNG